MKIVFNRNKKSYLKDGKVPTYKHYKLWSKLLLSNIDKAIVSDEDHISVPEKDHVSIVSAVRGAATVVKEVSFPEKVNVNSVLSVPQQINVNPIDVSVAGATNDSLPENFEYYLSEDDEPIFEGPVALPVPVELIEDSFNFDDEPMYQSLLSPELPVPVTEIGNGVEFISQLNIAKNTLKTKTTAEEQWQEEEESIVIDFFSQNDCLWNAKHAHYYKRSRSSLLDKIVEELEFKYTGKFFF